MLTFRSFEQRAFFWALLIATFAFAYLIHDFLEPVFWAGLLATLFHTLQQRLTVRLNGHASISAALVLLLVVVSVVVPLVLITAAVIHESSAAVERLAGSGEVDADASIAWAQRLLSPLQAFFARVGIDAASIEDGISSAAVAGSKFVATHALAIGQNTLLFAIQLLAMLYVLFFFLRDADRLVKWLIRVLPMGDDRERRLLSKFAAVANAMIKGTFVVAAVQGVLGGLAFWVLGVPSAVLWGVVMTMLCIVPVFGSFLVWLPASIWLFANGDTGKAIGLVVFGVFVISVVDNLLRPRLVSRDTRLPDYVVLISTLGGIAVLGASGFVIGPIAAALCVAGWEMFADETKEGKAKAA